MNKKSALYKIGRDVYYKYKELTSIPTFFLKYDFIEKEHIKRFGDDFCDKTFYVIRRGPRQGGLLSNFHWVLNYVVYAVSKGYVPVVNMENYKTFYNEKTPVDNGAKKTLNAWEYYFEQPCGYSLEDIKSAQHVILGDMHNFVPVGFLDVAAGVYNGELEISKYNEFARQYCKFNLKTDEYIEKQRETLFENKKNILGVLHRGTDMKTAKEHFTPATIEQTIQKTKQAFREEKFDFIFLRTEEQCAVDEFRKAFGSEKLIVSDIQRFKEYKNGSVPEIIQKTSLSACKDGLDYLTDVYLLSLCDGIIASKTNGTSFALGLNNNNYRYAHIFDFGINW